VTLSLPLSGRRLGALVIATAMIAAAVFAALTSGGPRSVGLGAAAPAHAKGSISPHLERLAKAHPGRRVEVIVQLAHGTSAADGRALVETLGGRVTRDLHIIHAFGVKMTAAAAVRLAESRAVRAVSPNAAVAPRLLSISLSLGGTSGSSGSSPPPSGIDPSKLATSFNQSVRAPDAWNSGTRPTTGKGVRVAVIDTGVQGDHPDFRRSSTNSESRVIASTVVNPEATRAGDGYGHGTHVAGLIAGDSTSRPGGDPKAGRYAGAAPDADIVSVKVSDEDGNATVLDVIDGLQFVVDHKDALNIRVANLSLTSTVAESYKTDPLDAAVEQTWFSGVVVVAAAGNDGATDGAVGYAPANDPYVLTVGGVDDKGTKSISDDVVASWSSRGKTQDGFSKPEVVAPGAHIVSTLAPQSDFAEQCPSCVHDGEYIRLGGTSMAAAVASGVAADVIAANPTWTPNQVKGAMVNRARPLPLSGSSNEVSGYEIAADRARDASSSYRVSNQGLTPNNLIDPSTGQIDFGRASWRRASWRELDSADMLRASWSRASWRVDDATGVTNGTTVDSARASWRRASWRVSFTK
jgi:serine protease AprX